MNLLIANKHSIIVKKVFFSQTPLLFPLLAQQIASIAFFNNFYPGFECHPCQSSTLNIMLENSFKIIFSSNKILTRDGWVRSVYAASVLCHPPISTIYHITKMVPAYSCRNRELNSHQKTCGNQGPLFRTHY